MKLWATLHAMLHNPAVAAKMIATLDHISGGRAGLNIVAGAYRGEFDQMGAWDDSLDHDDRYDAGRGMDDAGQAPVERAQRHPRGPVFPLQGLRVAIPSRCLAPRPDLICAGMSERGFEFAVREADACFIGGRTPDDRRDASRRAKAVADKYGKTVKTYAMCTVVYAETDAKAEALVERYREGVDMGAVIEMLKSWGVPPERLTEIAKQQGAFMTQTAVGSPATCADEIEEFIGHAELDGLMLIFPDYVEGLKMFGADILPGPADGDRMNAAIPAEAGRRGAPNGAAAQDRLAGWIAPARTALLVIDMQVDFASPEGALGQAGLDLSAVPPALTAAERLAETARRRGAPVVFVGLQTSAGGGFAGLGRTDAPARRRSGLGAGTLPARNARRRLRRAHARGRRYGGGQDAATAASSAPISTPS